MSVSVNNPPSSTATRPDVVLTKHVITANTTITAGYGAYFPRYIEIAAGITLEIDVDADLEIG